MASNAFWGFSTWGSGNWGDIGRDLTIQVGGTTNEVSGTGYTAGGTTLTISTATVQQDIAFVNFNNATFSTATLSASACLIYNTTNSKKAVVVLDFTTTQTATNGSFTIQFPAANSTSAILRIN